jgi:hypothetical protein
MDHKRRQLVRKLISLITVGMLFCIFSVTESSGSVPTGAAAGDGSFGADFAALSAGNYSGGDGTVENPYRIASIIDLMELSNSPDDWNKSFLMTADIDCIGVEIAPIGSSFVVPFYGFFDGAGHVISNLTIVKPVKSHVGLFGVIGGGQIKNLGVVNVNAIGFGDVGGLVGVNFGVITSCYATGSVEGGGYVGGLAGSNAGTLSFCYATSVNGRGSYLGGLVGGNLGTLNSCYATGSVEGTIDVGGLVGNNALYGALTSCYATGSVNGTSGVGGLVGNNWGGPLNSCYATGSVNGTSEVGGLVGNNWGGPLNSCYATGSVTGTNRVGGLVGWNAGAVPASYYSTDFAGGTYYAGGLVELNDDGTLISCYATGSVTGTNRVGGLVGLIGS